MLTLHSFPLSTLALQTFSPNGIDSASIQCLILTKIPVVALLKPNIDGWSIVMAGHWNRVIFSPAWITGHLTSVKDIGIEVPVDNPGLPIRLTFEGIHLCVTSKQLVLTVERAEDALLEKCRDVAISALKELPHTPLMAVGVNYHFVAEQPDDALLQVFNLADNNRLSDADVKIRSTIIQRTLLIKDQTVNLSLTLADDKKVHVAFNFHKDTPSTEQAVAFLGAHSTDLKEKAFDLLNKIYQSTAEPVAATL